MYGNQYLDIKPEVAEAIAQGKPVVALESTIISHGMRRQPCRWSRSSGKTERCPPPSPSLVAG